MTRSELATIISNRFPTLQKRDVEDSVSVILDAISHSLSRGGILHKDTGCGSELDYVERISWIFLNK
jgi:hypothetical protein